jgi:tetratricopeptide (TPR) repeat protein
MKTGIIPLLLVPCLLAFLVPTTCVAQSQSQSQGMVMEMQFQEIMQEVDGQPAELTHAGRLLREGASGDCNALQVGWALELYAAAFSSGVLDVEQCLKEVALCVEPYTRLHLFAGFLLYQQGKLEQALDQMNIALLDKIVLTEALDARGGLHALMGMYDLAVRDFERLIAVSNDRTPPSIFVNLSGIHLVANNWKEAIRWTNLGLDAIQRKKDASAPSSPQFIQLAVVERALLANQLSAATRMGDRALAVSTWHRMKLMDIEGEQLSNLKSILEFALSDDRYQIYDFVLSKGERRWSELGAADWSQMGGTQLLLNPAWSRYFFEDGKSLSALDSLQRRWFIVKQLWGQTPVDRQWKATQDPSVVESSASFILWVLVLGTGVFAAIVGVRWWRLRDTLSVKATDDWDLREFIASLEELGPNNNFTY